MRISIRIITVSVLCLLLAGCATPTPAGLAGPAGAQATLAAAEYQRSNAAIVATQQAEQRQAAAATATQQVVSVTQAAAVVATATAAQATQSWQATAGSLNAAATTAAIDAQRNDRQIAAGATATALARIAAAEDALLADEQRRLALQRQAEAEELRYQRTMNTIKPVLWFAVIVSVLVVGMAYAYKIYRQSQPIVFNEQAGARLLLPAGAYQALSGVRTVQPDRPLLPAPDITVRPLPALAGHVLIAGPTDAGKSTAMRAVLQHRENVVVLDPHYAPGNWRGARVLGGGRNFEEIGAYMQWMMAELDRRAKQLKDGRREFDPLTVATDEMPAIADELGRGTAVIWRKWLREGRKFGLLMVVSTQSTRVKTLGIEGEGDVLRNFQAALLLGATAVEAYPDLTSGQQRPAVLRTIEGVQPVIVPNVPPGNGDGAAADDQPLYVAPEPQQYADPANLDAATRARIRQLADELPSQAAIERAVFGYNGGAAWQAVSEVLRGNGATTTNGRV